MGNGLWRWLRGARGIEVFAALAVAALVALMLLGGGAGRDAPDKTDLEARLERILSRIDGAGKVTAMIAEDGDGNPTGALVVADGLTDIKTYLCLQKAVMALIALEPGSIEIVGKDGGFGGAM